MIEILDAGFYTSIQDQGRKGHRHLGVPVSGAMDQKAFELAHALFGEQLYSSIIECTLIGPKLLFHERCSLVLTGAIMEAWLNEKPLKNNTPIHVLAGDELKLGRVLSGLRTYIKINKSLILPAVLGSTSFYSPITKSAYLKSGIHLFWMKNDRIKEHSNSKLRWDDSYLTDQNIYSEKGPEYGLLSDEQKKLLFKNIFKVEKQSRMGYRIGSAFETEPVSMLSGAIRPGTVQITPSGVLLIAGFDGQVTGGYPRILQLTDQAMNVMFQKKEGDSVSFKFYDKLHQKEL